jgi:glutathione synthase/RimK-type ligase-like ATP-grasp enzyme
VLRWDAVLDDGAALRRAIDRASHVRVDSPGRDAELDARLVAHGGGDGRVVERGRIVARAAWYRGLVAAMQRLETYVGVTPISHRTHHVALAFDKARCHARLDACGVAVPEALPSVGGWDELRAHLSARGWTRAFVKPCHGSAGSGVIALRCDRDRVDAWTSIELEREGRGVRLFNVRPLRRHRDERDVAAMVDALGEDGIHVERWLPKASWPGVGAFDLRVLAIHGEPTHACARVGGGPITNLQLGARRIHGAALHAQLGDAWPRVQALVRRAATAFAGAWHVAFDVLLVPGHRRIAVLEANAFGDLLYGVVDRDGRGTHAAQLDARHHA